MAIKKAARTDIDWYLISIDRLKKPAKCSVCGDETAGVGPEPLCWVCRRLKISAWKEIEQQMPVQE